MLNRVNVKLPVIGIYINHQCNLQCQHCFWATNRTFLPDLSIEEWEYILKRFIEFGTKHFHICGREPMLSKKVFDILNFLSNIKGKHNLRYGIITNGTLFTKENVSNLINLGLDYIEISIDGMKSYNDYLRGGGTFEKVMNSIRLISGKGIHPSIASLIFNNNTDDLIEMCRSLYDTGVRKFFFQFLRPFDHKNFDLLITPKLLSSFINQLSVLIKRYKSMSLQIEIPAVFIPYVYKNNDLVKNMFDTKLFMIKTNLNSVLRIRHHPYSCQAFLHRARITADGYLLGCDMFIAYPDYRELAAGNLRENDPLKLLFSFLEKGGQELLANLFKKPSKCIKCSYLQLCGGGCRAYSRLLTGLWDMPECELFQKETELDFQI